MTPDAQIWRRVVAALVVTRILMAVGIAVAVAWGLAHPGPNLLDSVFNSWDGKAYIRIADHGYSTLTDPVYATSLQLHGFSLQLNADDAFLPAYPAAVRIVGTFFGNNWVVAGLLVSLGAEAVALFYIYRFAEQERDAPLGNFALWGMALAPFAFFMGAVYTESLFIAAAAAAFYYMRGGRFTAASIATLIACSTRITGAALIVALIIEYLRQNKLSWHRDVLMVCLTPLPFAVFALYMSVHVGDALALFHANTVFFGHEFAAPWTGMQATWRTYDHAKPGLDKFVWFRELAFGIAGMVLCFVAWLARSFPRSMAAYCTIVVLSAVSISFWRSVPRYELALFPMVLVVAVVLGDNRWVRGFVLVASAACFTVAAGIYAQGWLA